MLKTKPEVVVKKLKSEVLQLKTKFANAKQKLGNIEQKMSRQQKDFKAQEASLREKAVERALEKLKADLSKKRAGLEKSIRAMFDEFAKSWEPTGTAKGRKKTSVRSKGTSASAPKALRIKKVGKGGSILKKPGRPAKAIKVSKKIFGGSVLKGKGRGRPKQTAINAEGSFGLNASKKRGRPPRIETADLAV